MCVCVCVTEKENNSPFSACFLFPFLLSASETCKKKHKQSMLTNYSLCGPHVVALKPLKCSYILYIRRHTSTMPYEPKHTDVVGML